MSTKNNHLTGKQILALLVLPAVLITVMSYRTYKRSYVPQPQKASYKSEQQQEKAFNDLRTFLELLVQYKVKGIEDVNYKSRYLVITVSNYWHVMPYQTRLQRTQDLWQIWADIHSPNSPDNARIKIVDFNGNIVGGSKALSGSLIWVQNR